VAQELSPLCRQGLRIAVLEKGPRLRDEEFTGRELEMAGALYEDGGGFLTADGAMTIAFGCAYGGSTVVYTGTSMLPPERVIDDGTCRASRTPTWIAARGSSWPKTTRTSSKTASSTKTTSCSSRVAAS
jgi:choline dehydrogenase-like flavoprotein